MARRDADGRDAKTVMVEVAERMFGEHGIDGVSMRDVAASAGQRNNSAVQYHFGSREGLIFEVVRRRMTEIDSDRRARLALIDDESDDVDITALVGVLFEPIINLLRDQPEATHYARFLQQMGPVVGPTIPETELRSATDDVVVRLINSLDHLPRRTAFERIDLVTHMVTGALAVYEDRRDARNTVVNTRFEDVVSHLYDMAVAALLAVDSRQAGAAGGAGAVGGPGAAGGTEIARGPGTAGGAAHRDDGGASRDDESRDDESRDGELQDGELRVDGLHSPPLP